VRPSRPLGQSFLVDPFVADAEAALLGAAPGTPVVEIGGGLGILTDALLRRGAEPLTVIERDPRLAAFLRRRFGRRVKVLEANALDVTYPEGALVAGNLPFSVATPILVTLWKNRTPRVVVMVQREVAERIAAAPRSKAYGRLSILAALYGTTELYQTVPSRLFHPAPEVEGRILVHTTRAGPLPVPSVEAFERLVQVLFSSRRKQLGNLFLRLVPSAAAAREWANAAGWSAGWERKRPEELPSEAYFALATAAPTPGSGKSSRGRGDSVRS
jgi:16S rRNA (adenine1518-N6/adenine1519-N6)-dimethyltransferase